jgi:hypothetical protein
MESESMSYGSASNKKSGMKLGARSSAKKSSSSSSGGIGSFFSGIFSSKSSALPEEKATKSKKQKSKEVNTFKSNRGQQ